MFQETTIVSSTMSAGENTERNRHRYSPKSGHLKGKLRSMPSVYGQIKGTGQCQKVGIGPTVNY